VHTEQRREKSLERERICMWEEEDEGERGSRTSNGRNGSILCSALSLGVKQQQLSSSSRERKQKASRIRRGRFVSLDPL